MCAVFILLLLPSVLMDPSTLGSLLVRSRPTAVVVTPTPTEIVPYKIPNGIIDYLLANRYAGDIPVSTCYICHNYVHYLSLQVYQGCLS